MMEPKSRLIEVSTARRASERGRTTATIRAATGTAGNTTDQASRRHADAGRDTTPAIITANQVASSSVSHHLGSLTLVEPSGMRKKQRSPTGHHVRSSSSTAPGMRWSGRQKPSSRRSLARNTALYDEWRQVLFIYPALLLFAVAGAKWLLDSAGALAPSWGRPLHALLTVGAVAMVGWTVFRMVELHPYQGLYFNAAVGEADGAEGRFELDYWGLSYKEGLDHLLVTTTGPVKLNACDAPGPGVDAARLFRAGDRLRYVPMADADFAICAPRSRPPAAYLPGLPTRFRVSRDGATFLYVKAVPDQAETGG